MLVTNFELKYVIYKVVCAFISSAMSGRKLCDVGAHPSDT
jgi:hypothetical protein